MAGRTTSPRINYSKPWNSTMVSDFRTPFFRCLTLLAMSFMSLAQAGDNELGEFWTVPYPQPFDSSQLGRSQSLIRVEQNGFVDDSGSEFVFRGVSIADPLKLVKEGKWSAGLFDVVAEWGANTVRLPIHPPAWRQLGPDRYLELIDEAVVWANRHDMYLIIDWHSIGYLPTEQYQHVMYDTTIKETLDFWRIIAFRYQGIPTVAVYEIFNEPTTQGNTLGARDWQEWKSFNELVIDMIYARDPNVIPLVAGFDWAYDLRNVRAAPIERPGVAYAAHPYPQKAKPDNRSDDEYFRLWDESWGYVSDSYPMIASELGWVREDGYGAHIPVIDDGSYGPRIMKFMQQRGISWIAWCFDPQWSPVLITDWDFSPSEQGYFFRRVLQESNGDADNSRPDG